MQTLDEVPSPYLSGVFDDIISRNPTVFWNATCETNRGCPYACTFCDWGGLTQSKIKKFQLERVAAEIEWMSQRAIKSVFIADSNFGIFRERDMEIAKLFRAWLDRDTGLEYISTNYAKNSNAVVFEIAKILGAVNKGITFSVQSMNPDTLKVIKRQNMDTNDTREMLSLARAHGVHFYTELMLPLPLETLETWKAGVCELLELGQHHRIELNTVAILENTEMNSVQRDKYRMQTIQVKGLQGLAVEESGIDEYVNIVKSTNTMTTSDVIEAYLYTWMVSNLHMNNYTQILSKYHRYVNHIPYREFYDRVFADLSQGGDSVVHRHFDRVRTALENLYSVGDTGIQDLYLGVLMSDATLDFYHNITDVLDFSKRLALSLGDVDPGVMQIQERALFNEIYTVPFQVRTEHDIDTWQPGPCVYDINSAGSAVDINYKNFYATLRRDKSKIFNVICRRS